MKLFFLFVCFLSLCLLQASVWSIPSVLDGLIILYVLKRSVWIFLFAVVVGVFLDAITFQQIGVSSILFVIVFFFIELYSRKFEVKTVSFVFFASCISGIVYSMISGVSHVFLEGFLGSILAIIIFISLNPHFAQRDF